MLPTDPRGYVIGWGEHDAAGVAIESFRVYDDRAQAELRTVRSKGEEVYALIPVGSLSALTEECARRDVAAELVEITGQIERCSVEIRTLAMIALGVLGTAPNSSAVAPLIRQAVIRLGLTESDVTGGGPS